MSDDITVHDARTHRCPMLGHDVPFAYCRAPARELPCRKVFDCWWETFDVEGFVRAHFREEDIEAILAPPAPKVATLVDLIRRARQADVGPRPPSDSLDAGA